MGQCLSHCHMQMTMVTVARFCGQVHIACMPGLCRPRIFRPMISKASMILAFSIDAKASNKDLLFFTPPFSIILLAPSHTLSPMHTAFAIANYAPS